MLLLDTNVVSESFRPRPDVAVGLWMDTAPRDQLFTSSITKAELLLGLAGMPQGRRKFALAEAIWSFFSKEILTEVLPFGSLEAELYAEILAHKSSIGRPMSQSDAEIAAIARSHGFAVVTRNVRDFEHCGVTVINPWEPG